MLREFFRAGLFSLYSAFISEQEKSGLAMNILFKIEQEKILWYEKFL